MQQSLAVPVLLLLMSACGVGRIEGKAFSQGPLLADAEPQAEGSAGRDSVDTGAPPLPEAGSENTDTGPEVGAGDDAFEPPSDDTGVPLVDDGGLPNPL